ncbi:uncharacterized protein LOC141691978 [Apium graveolens]|uniref:uncharacterized protein LOC141691978 n=1 Tax=Apium graveolens TaxID=4045 RepID=UPI003D7961C7
MSEFSGKDDPEDHYEKYELLMIGMGHNDIMLCKMFKTYLKGSASMWYKSLKPRPIGSYEELKRKFLKYYSHLYRKAKDTEALVHCRKRANEELGDYLARFKEEAEMVTNLDKVKAMGFLTAGLDPYKGKKLRSSLYNFPPKSLNDIYVRGENIHWKMESIGDIRTPEGMTDQSEPTDTKAKDQALTEGCILDKDSKTTKKKYARQLYNLYQFGQAKPHMPMTFNTEDYEDVIRSHEDPLIINPIIGHNKIWKVMIDTGSSANILFHKTYCKMNLAGEQLEPCNEAPLYTIGGHLIQFEGTITLPVLLGKLPYTVEKPVKFYVV